MELLSAVNLILPALGERVVTSLDPVHPTVNLILSNMDIKRKELLTKGWWFNTRRATLYPENDGSIRLPVRTLSVFSDNGIQDGDLLVDRQTLESVWTTGQDVTLKVDREYGRLPEYAAYVVLYSGLIQTYLTDIGMEGLLKGWATAEEINLSNLTAEHLRNMRYSTRRSPSYRRIKRAYAGG